MVGMSNDLMGIYDIRGTEDAGLTVEYAWNVGKALADWLPTTGSVVVVYAPTVQHIAKAAIEGLRLQGRNVVDGGNGDSARATSYIKTAGLSGAIVVGRDDSSDMTIIELYREDAKRIDSESGLKDIQEAVLGGNFLPAATKGELTQFV